MDPSESELAGLSEEERAALAEEDEAPAPTEDPEEPETPETPEEPKAEEPKAEEPEPEAKADEPEADDDTAPFVPRYVAPKVEGYDEQRNAIAEEERKLRDQFREGEITVDEMMERLSGIDAKKEALVKAKVKEEISEESATQTAAQQWQWEVGRFLRTTLRTEGIDYKKDPILNSALDAMVKHLAAEEKNADQPAEWFLEEAHRQIKSRFNLGAKPKEETPTPPKAPAKPESRKPDLRSVPPNVGEMPASSGSDDVSGGEFAYLDKLTGMDLERELAKLSTEQQERWLRSA